MPRQRNGASGSGTPKAEAAARATRVRRSPGNGAARLSAEMNFCSRCGSPLKRRWMKEARRYRAICVQCNAIAYENPKILVTTIVTCRGRVLLCLRAEPPKRLRWTAPAGFMECGETLEEAAAREVREETRIALQPKALQFYALSTLRDISQVYVSFRAEVRGSRLGCGPECLQVRYFAEDEFPWSKLAYPEMIGFFRLFFRERQAGAYAIHLTHLDAREISRRSYAIGAVEHVRRIRGAFNRIDDR